MHADIVHICFDIFPGDVSDGPSPNLTGQANWIISSRGGSLMVSAYWKM